MARAGSNRPAVRSSIVECPLPLITPSMSYRLHLSDALGSCPAFGVEMPGVDARFTAGQLMYLHQENDTCGGLSRVTRAGSL